MDGTPMQQHFDNRKKLMKKYYTKDELIHMIIKLEDELYGDVQND